MEVTNSYIGGMDRDSSPLKVKATKYYLLKNGHVVTEEDGLSTQSVENERGTLLSFTIPDTENIYKLTCYINPHIGGITYGDIAIPTSSDPTTHYFPSGYTLKEIYSDLVTWYATDIANGDFAIYSTVENIYIVGLNSPITVIGSLDIPSGGTNSVSIEITVPAQTDLKICGWTTSRDEVIVCTTNNSSSTPGKNGQADSYGQIWKFSYNEITREVENSVANMLVPQYHLFYNNLLNFSTYNRVKKIIARYENSLFSKIYFTDGYNYLRHFNFNNPNHLIIEPTKLNLISDVDMNSPTLYNIGAGGKLTSGRVQYCYQLFDNYGAETVVSPASNLIDITESDDTALSSIYYKGKEALKDCGKTVTIYIRNLDLSFDMVRVICLYYADINTDPTIRILEERSVESGNVLITDGGDEGISTLTLEEFRDLGGKLFISQSIETKNRKLFAANIKEDYFDIDFDARCFRYRLDPILGEITYASTITPGVEKDDINPYNIQSNDSNASCRYIYQKGQTTPGNTVLGGTGVDQFSLGVPNVSYKFGLQRLDGDHGVADNLYVEQDPTNPLTLPTNHINNSWNSNKSAYIADVFRGYQRDEVYRVGFVLFDLKFRPSFVKWCGDIRMPAMGDSDMNFTKGFPIALQDGGYLNPNQLYSLFVDFTVNIPSSIISQISGFSIVRVKREGVDKTIVANGILSRPTSNGIGLTPADPVDYINFVPAGAIFNSNNPIGAYNFLSPEVNFNKNITLKSVDSFRIEGELPLSSPTLFSSKLVDTNSLAATDAINWDTIVAAGTYSDYTEGIDSSIINNAYTDLLTVVRRGTCMWGRLSTITPFNGILTSLLDAPMVNYRRMSSSQYGGASKVARANSEYIWCNNFTPVSAMTDNVTYKTASVKLFGGDTYVGYFDYYRGYYDNIITSGDAKLCFFPCESSINVELRHDPCWSRTHYAGIDEYDNPYDSSVPGGPYDTGDLYAYNSAYSREPDTVRFFPKPINFQGNTEYDARILNTEERYSDQIIDNWLKFKYNDFTEVDQSFGPITKIIDHNNVMHFVQTMGIGVIAIDERVTTLDSTGATMVLGTGDTLGKYGYISKVSGSIHHDSIISAPSGLHYFDIRNRKWMLYTGETNSPLNDVKGLSSFFLKNLRGHIQEADKPLTYTPYPVGIVGVYDVKRNRVLMTFLDFKEEIVNGHMIYSRSFYTFSYSELLGAFESELSFYPPMYLMNRDRLLSIDPYNMQNGYIHDAGTRGVYYEESPADMELIIAVNPYPDISKIFTNATFNSSVTLADVDQYNETVTSIEVYNDYQNSGVLVLTPGSTIKRRLRTWRIQLPRSNDYRSTNYDATLQNDARLLDRYVFLRFKYLNNNDKRLVLNDITTTYIPKQS